LKFVVKGEQHKHFDVSEPNNEPKINQLKMMQFCHQHFKALPWRIMAQNIVNSMFLIFKPAGINEGDFSIKYR
jgi:hypothetical protein